MRATIDRRDLIAALKATAPCRSANAHLPAIRCARIEASSGQVEITSTDLDLTIHKWVDATDVNNGVAVVPAAAVSAFLAACSTDKVTLDLGDRLTVTCGDASIASNVVPAEEWPRVPIVSGDEHHLDASTVEAIRLSLHALSVEEARPVLCCLQTKEGHLVATDSHRLVATPTDLPDGLLIPPALLRSAAANAGPATLRVDGDLIAWLSGSLTVQARGFSGQPVNWKALLHRDQPHEITVNAEALAGAVKAVTAVEAPAVPVRLSVADNRLTVSLSGDEASADATIDAKATDAPTFALNPRYLLDALAAHVEETITFRLVDPLKPIQWDNGPSRCLLMPVKLGVS